MSIFDKKKKDDDTKYVTPRYTVASMVGGALVGQGGGGSLTVKEIDSAPTVNNVTTIQVTNGTLTDNGGGNVTISIGGAALNDPGSNGIVVRTALNTTTARSLTQPAAGITISNSDGVAGNPTFALANDLSAVEGLAANGMATRTAADTWTVRTLTGTANVITITNGDGVAGNPTFTVGSLVVRTDQANTWTTGAQDMGAATSFKVPTSAGASPTASGLFAYDSTSNTMEYGANGTNRTVVNLDEAQTLSSKTLTTPTIASFTNATHDHTNAAGGGQVPIATGISGLAAGIATFLGTPSSANLATAVTDETGTAGNLVFSTSPSLTTPRVITSLNDTNGNELFTVTATGSAVNELSIVNQAVGSATVPAYATLTTTGNDTDIGLNFNCKGAGLIYIGNGSTNASPATPTITATGGNGSNIAGANLVVSGGKGTGNATPGLVVHKFPLVGASGTTLQSLSSNSYNVAVKMFSQTADQTIANTTTETTLLGSGNGTKSVEAGMGRVGTTLRICVQGIKSATAAPTIRYRVKIGGVTVLDSGAVATANAQCEFTIFAQITIRTLGATGTVIASGYVIDSASGVATWPLFATGTSTVDTTAAMAVDVTQTWGTANALNTQTSQISLIDYIP